MRSEKQKKRKGLSGGVRYGPPPKKGPNPQGIKVSERKKLLRKTACGGARVVVGRPVSAAWGNATLLPDTPVPESQTRQTTPLKE